MVWYCSSCGKHFFNNQKQRRRNANGRLLFTCPACGSKRIGHN